MNATGEPAVRASGEFAAAIKLGVDLLKQGAIAEALGAFERAVAIDPASAMARVHRADAEIYLGDTDGATASFRAALAINAACGPAWWGLAAMRTIPFDDREYEQLRTLYGDGGVPAPDRIAIGFALAKALEDRGLYAEAFATLRDVNAAARRGIDWNAADFGARVDQLLRIFPASSPVASGTGTLGREAIFIVSLPRAGSTLTEQILAAHPDVEGASELPDLGAVIAEESARRGSGFLSWAADASIEDWSRLGLRYLERTERWRRTRPRFTDKMPNNWLYLGAVLAMLPGARVIDCRRDPVETCWSCFRQLFSSGAVFSYDLDDIAAYYKAYDRAMRHWSSIYPGRIRTQSYEALVAEPAGEIAALLDFCDLPMREECLRFQTGRRVVRTASAAQVRQPLRKDTARARNYGELLDPLRRALDS